MRTVALVSMKGGSGKTTAAVHIAVAAAQQGRNVALIDTDPQQSAARWGDRRAAALPVVLTVPPSGAAIRQQGGTLPPVARASGSPQTSYVTEPPARRARMRSVFPVNRPVHARHAAQLGAEHG